MIKHATLKFTNICGHGDVAFNVRILNIEWTDGTYDMYTEMSSGEYRRAYGSTLAKNSKLGAVIHIGDVIAVMSGIPILRDVSTEGDHDDQT